MKAKFWHFNYDIDGNDDDQNSSNIRANFFRFCFLIHLDSSYRLMTMVVMILTKMMMMMKMKMAPTLSILKLGGPELHC